MCSLFLVVCIFCYNMLDMSLMIRVVIVIVSELVMMLLGLCRVNVSRVLVMVVIVFVVSLVSEGFRVFGL